MGRVIREVDGVVSDLVLFGPSSNRSCTECHRRVSCMGSAIPLRVLILCYFAQQKRERLLYGANNLRCADCPFYTLGRFGVRRTSKWTALIPPLFN